METVAELDRGGEKRHRLRPRSSIRPRPLDRPTGSFCYTKLL